MELEVLNVTKVSNAVVSTNNARYEVGYTTLGEGDKTTLCKVEARVFNGDTLIGTLLYSYDKVTTTQFPYSVHFTTYINDFNEIVGAVNTYIASEKKVADSSISDLVEREEEFAVEEDAIIVEEESKIEEEV